MQYVFYAIHSFVTFSMRFFGKLECEIAMTQMCCFDPVFLYILLYDRFIYIYIHEGLPSFAIPLWYYGLFFLTATKFGLGGSPQGSMG